MRFKFFILSFLIFAASGCAMMVPKIDKQQTVAKRCDLVTRKLSLETEPLQVACGGSPFCPIVSGLVIFPLSAVVSGSIVAIGNSMYWIESELACDAKPEQATVAQTN